MRDHCHFTGKYRGAAHNQCNLSCRKPLILPVIFHNLQGYDAHLFIKQLAKVDGDLTSIPTTEEKYISFSKHIHVDQYHSKKYEKVLFKNFEIRFIDSFKFLQTSLSNLVSNLQPSDFTNLQKNVKTNSSLLTRKGVYPYDYVTSIDELKETKLPPKEAFYSLLYNEEISDEDYQHAHNVWNTFNCQNLQDYHDLYLKSDVLLLADVFENFRKTCLKYYKLDPCHNFDRATIFDEHLVAIHMKKTEVYFNKPIYVGQAILDLSKTLMFDFHYNYIKKKYGQKAELLMTDTDSLMYLIQTDDVYDDIKHDVKKKFDTSNFPDNHPSGIKSGANEKVIGMFKNEAAANNITHFVGLSSKSYSYLMEISYGKNGKLEEPENDTIRKAKGVKKNVIKKSLTFEDYKKCLFSEEKVLKEMNIIRSKNHDIYSMNVNKVAISANDDNVQIKLIRKL